MSDSEPLINPTADVEFAQDYIYRQYQFDAFIQYFSRGAKWGYLDLYNISAKKIAEDCPDFVKANLLFSYKIYAERNVF